MLTLFELRDFFLFSQAWFQCVNDRIEKNVSSLEIKDKIYINLEDKQSINFHKLFSLGSNFIVHFVFSWSLRLAQEQNKHNYNEQQ